MRIYKDKIVIRSVEEKDLIQIGNVVMKAKLPQLVEEGLSENEVKEIYQKYSPKNLKVKFADNFYFLAEKTSPHFIAEVPNEKNIVGVIGLRKDDGSEIHNRLSTFFIDPKYQNMGIGRILYEKVKEVALEKKCLKMVVSSSSFAEPIYKHFGFSPLLIDTNRLFVYNSGVWRDTEAVIPG